MNIYFQISLATIFGAASGGAVSYFAKLYFSEKIKGNIKSEYDRKIESIKSDLKKNETAIASALISQSQSLQMGQNETVEAIKLFWQHYLIIRQILSPITYTDWYLYESEINSLFTQEWKGGNKVPNEFQSIDYSQGNKIALSVEVVEKLRPFLTTNLWIYFTYYKTFSGRTMYLYEKGVEEKQMNHWKNDELLIGITKEILSEEEFDFIKLKKIATIDAIQEFLEQKMLIEISKILTGHNAAENTYLQALRLIDLNKKEN